MTIKRTAKEKTRIGELILFFAMLGVHMAPSQQRGKLGTRYEGPALAEYLAADGRRVAKWWDSLSPDEMLYQVQEIAPPAGWDNRIAARWCDMTPQAQDYWARSIARVCNSNLLALRQVNREALAAGCHDAEVLAGAA